MSNASRKVRLFAGMLLCLICGTITTLGRPLPAADKAAIERGIAAGTRWLQEHHGEISDHGEKALAALALVKCGVPHDSPVVSAVLKDTLGRIDPAGKYAPPGHHAYMAAVDAMFLYEIDAQQYLPRISAIRDWLVNEQMPNGAWTYGSRDAPGDTSVTQYACLGLWTAELAGAAVPIETWDRVLEWHAKYQIMDGGYCYNPCNTGQYDGGNSSLNMTIAAIGSMMIAARHAFPERGDSLKQLMQRGGPSADDTPPKPDPSADPLTKIDLSTAPEPEPEPTAAAKGPSKTAYNLGQLQTTLGRALGWLAPRFVPMRASGPANYHLMYYIYSVERTMSLLGETSFGSHDWYGEGSTELLKLQNAAGHWEYETTFSNKHRDTSFALLFLSRSTGKILKRGTTVESHGGGLLTGGKGEPTEVAAARKEPTPLDKLLKSLQDPAALDLGQAQSELIEQVQLGDRTELIGQKETLVKLIQHPHGEVRRTAAWALGRTNDLHLARYLVAALEDQDVGVMMEAHAALSWLSRRFDGYGLPVNPLDDVAENASEEERQAAINGWRARARQNWGTWYLRVRPYADRGDEFEAGLRQRLGEK